MTGDSQAFDLPRRDQGRREEAVACLKAGRLEKAANLYKKLVAENPESPYYLHQLAVTFYRLDRLEEAARCVTNALTLAPGNAEAQNNLGAILREQGYLEKALVCFRRAMTLNPAYVDALSNVGSAFGELGRWDEAITVCRQAIAIDPSHPRVPSNMGVSLQRRGRFDEAITAFRRALALNPALPESHYNLSMALLRKGEYREGWREHEWIWKGGSRTIKARSYDKPRWQGESLAGRTLFLYGEQGLGDVLQFIRFVSQVAALGATVVVEVYRPLTRLLASVAGVAQVVAPGDPLPDFDFHLPLLGLPHRLDLTVDTIPNHVPYIRADDALIKGWAARLAGRPGLKVGLVWSGDPRPHDSFANAIDRRRSMPLARLIPLLKVAGVTFVSLQKGVRARQLDALPDDVRPLDWMDEVNDFADTAALVANLDMVIAVDTSIVHLVGAMGKPIWIMSRFDGCWRWLGWRPDSPWYPTARLFHQPSPGDWNSVIDDVAEQLTLLAASPDNPSASLAELFVLAVEHHRAGRLAEAERLYRSILSVEPNNVGCLYHLGLVALRCGQPQDAVVLLSNAAQRNDRVAGLQDALGTALSAVGRIAEAAPHHHRAVALQPDFPEAWFNLGNALNALADNDRAAVCFRQAAALRPEIPQPYNNLGHALVLGGLDAEAGCAFARAIALQPDFAEAHNNLGNILKSSGRLNEAANCFRTSIDLAPDYVEAHYNLANTIMDAGDVDTAVHIFRRAVTLRPDLAEAQNNLGSALHLSGLRDEALRHFQRALTLDPAFAEAHANLGTLAREAGDVAEAIAHYRDALALKPDYALGHSNLAVSLLLQGDYAEGFREFEWRRDPLAGLRTYDRPRWNGEPLAGKTIVLHCEQGLGDALQFCRYATPLAALGAQVILEAYPPLVNLLASVPGVSRVVPTGAMLPSYDYHLPMMSAPHLLGTTLETIPNQIPYLTPEPGRMALWRQRLDGCQGMKIGLVWAGDPRAYDPHARAIDRRRSFPLTQFLPLLALPGISFVSLQMGSPSGQISAIPEELRPIDWTAEIGDFADTAALVAGLDLVISVDTSMVHLAGAIGKPVWVLSRFDGCWRWLQNRSDSPWYPTARIFRQPSPNDWQTVIHEVAGALSLYQKY